MSHSYVSNYMHCTFSTKERYPFIDSELESQLWPYIGGIARKNRMKALAVGGTFDPIVRFADGVDRNEVYSIVEEISDT